MAECAGDRSIITQFQSNLGSFQLENTTTIDCLSQSCTEFTGAKVKLGVIKQTNLTVWEMNLSVIRDI